MADKPIPMVALNLPAELVDKMEALKRDREEDRNKSIEQLVLQFCETYVKVRELARWELAHMDELNRSYADNPNDWDDAAVWENEFKKAEEGPK